MAEMPAFLRPFNLPQDQKKVLEVMQMPDSDRQAMSPETYANPLVSHLFGGMANLVTAPGKIATPNPYPVGSEESDWYEGQRQKAINDWAPGMAISMMGAGAPAAEAGAVGIFGGRLAKTADRTALAKAEEMTKNGITKENIYAETGWFQGPDKKWRFEIPDKDSGMSGPGSIGDIVGKQGTVGDALTHDALFEAYPELKDIPLQGTDLLGKHGAMHIKDPIAGNSIAISNQAPLPRSQLLHELQHEIQDIEGFSPGSSSSSSNYRDIPGEIESRDVQNRMWKSKEQLKNQPPAVMVLRGNS